MGGAAAAKGERTRPDSLLGLSLARRPASHQRALPVARLHLHAISALTRVRVREHHRASRCPLYRATLALPPAARHRRGRGPAPSARVARGRARAVVH